MRKLFVLVLALTTILLLPAPASAQRLYRLDAVEGSHSPAKFRGASDCPRGDRITIESDGFVKGSSTATVGDNGIFQLSATIKRANVREGSIDIKSAMCAQKGPLEVEPSFGPSPTVSLFVPKGFVLPFTGVPVGRRLALGLSFLMAGVLLVRLSSRPSRRGSPSSRR
jgi:hypothetical protein